MNGKFRLGTNPCRGKIDLNVINMIEYSNFCSMYMYYDGIFM